MMQEVDVAGASASLAQTTIADELQDAAQTAVTQATTPPRPDTTAAHPPTSTAPPSGASPNMPSPPIQQPYTNTPSPPQQPAYHNMPSSPQQPAYPTMASPQSLQQPSTAGPPPPPTTGFVPGFVPATPSTAYTASAAAQGKTPASTPYMSAQAPPATPPQLFTPGPPPPQPNISPPSHSLPTMTAVEGSPAPPAYHQQMHSPLQPPSSVSIPHETSASVDLGGDSLGPVYPTHSEGGHGIMGWFSGGFMNKVMEKTKTLSENLVTTLDPGMKEVIMTGGDVDVVVASEKEVKVGAVRQAFQEIFGRATVSGQDSQPSIAPQPVGYTAGLKGCEERVQQLRQSQRVYEGQALVAVENFIVEVFPDKWFDMACLLLKDPARHIELQTFTQATPIDGAWVQQAQDDTPPDYPLRWSGLAVTVGHVIARRMPHVSHADWHMHMCGVSRKDQIYMAAKALATMYKQRLPPQL